MEKYIFCVIALLIQPIFAWSVYHKQDKRKAAMKVPLLYLSLAYLVIQIVVFWKYLRHFPDEWQMYANLIQLAILVIFLVLEYTLFLSNGYIDRIQEQEQQSIMDYRAILDEVQVCIALNTDAQNRQAAQKLYDDIRYQDPVSAPEVDAENRIIMGLVQRLEATADQEQFAATCDEIRRHVEARKIKNRKVEG